jgi:hypothetical protein
MSAAPADIRAASMRIISSEMGPAGSVPSAIQRIPFRQYGN